MTIKEFADKNKDYHNNDNDSNKSHYTVVTRSGRSYLGIVTPAQLRKVKPESWPNAIVNDISMQHIRAVKLDDLLYEVVEYMVLHDVVMLAVISNDRQKVIGGIVRQDILRYISRS